MSQQGISTELNDFTVCCLVTGYNPENSYSKYEQAEIVIKAINNSIPANWDDSKEQKYYLWFETRVDEKKKSGFTLVLMDAITTRTLMVVPDFMTFRTKEGALFFWENYKSLIEQVYLSND